MRVGLAAWLVVLLGLEAVLAQEPPTFATGVELVQIEVRVTDDEGAPVTNLTVEDFALEENGEPQKIEQVEYVSGPAGKVPVPGETPEAAPVDSPAQTTWLYISSEVRSAVEFTRVARSLRRFLQELPEGFVVSLGGLPFTDRRDLLLATLDRMVDVPFGGEAGPSVVDPTLDLQDDLVFQREVQAAATERATGIPSSFIGLQGDPIPSPPGGPTSYLSVERIDRQIIFSGSLALLRYLDLIERMAARPGKKMILVYRAGLRIEAEHSHLLRQMAASALRHRVSVFTFDPRGLEASEPIAEYRPQFARGTARLGLPQARRQDVDGLLILARNTGGQAVIDSNDGGEVLRRVVEEASDYYVLGYAPRDSAQRGRFRELKVSVGRPGAEVRSPRGYYEARPYDRLSDEERSVAFGRALPFEPPGTATRRLRVSTPVLRDVRRPRGDGELAGGPALIARRQFTPDATLQCRFEVYGAARLESSRMPRVSASYEVRRSDGTLYTREPRSLIEPADGGAVSRVIEFPLRAATPDDYEIVVRVKDELSGQTRELRETFKVTAPAGASPAAAGAPTDPAADTKTVGRYLDLVERSCGATDAALVTLSRWSSSELERVAQELLECDRCRQALRATAPSTSPADLDLGCRCTSPPWARAAALHTDLAFAVEPEADGLFHLGHAARVLERSGEDDLRRRWYRAVGLNCLFLEELETARSYLKEGLELFEEDPALLVALGATHETEAWDLRLLLRSLEAELIPVMGDLVRVRGEQRRNWSAAADLYEEVLGRHPAHSEARLRLGRVELLRGHTERGLEMLRWVTEHAREPDLIYLAHLFIGRELERSGDLDGALTSYRSALDADALGQAAYVATSHALRLSGRSTAAAEALERGLATRRSELIRDSWWRYPRARLGEAQELLTKMRAEVCQ